MFRLVCLPIALELEYSSEFRTMTAACHFELFVFPAFSITKAYGSYDSRPGDTCNQFMLTFWTCLFPFEESHSPLHPLNYRTPDCLPHGNQIPYNEPLIPAHYTSPHQSLAITNHQSVFSDPVVLPINLDIQHAALTQPCNTDFRLPFSTFPLPLRINICLLALINRPLRNSSCSSEMRVSTEAVMSSVSKIFGS
jgi:hypothetical protein